MSAEKLKFPPTELSKDIHESIDEGVWYTVLNTACNRVTHEYTHGMKTSVNPDSDEALFDGMDEIKRLGLDPQSGDTDFFWLSGGPGGVPVLED